MAKAWKYAAAVGVAAAAFATGASADTLSVVKQRGELICGTNQALPGFSEIQPDGNWAGFQIDFCRAVAAAVLGDPQKAKMRQLSAKERFTALQSGEVDLLTMNTTWTMNRDTALGAHFVGANFYDGQGFLVPKDAEITKREDFDGLTICVGGGTTAERTLNDVFGANGIKVKPVTFQGLDNAVPAFDQGRCDALTTDVSGLVSFKTRLSDPDAYEIAPLTISKEPLGPAVRQGDDAWANVVRWVLFSTINAEELGLTRDNIATEMNSEKPDVRRFVGAEGSLCTDIGLEKDCFAKVVAAVGNYGEIYERYLGPDTNVPLPRGLNRLWSDGGIMYAPPMK